MNFDLTPEQQLIQDSVARFVNEHYSLEQRQKTIRSKTGFSAEHWATMGDLGWRGLVLPEDLGGFGGNQLDTMLVMEQFGKGMVVEPLLPSSVIAGGAIARSDNTHLQSTYLPLALAGDQHLAFAWAEPQGRFDLFNINTTARLQDGHYLLNGHKSMVTNGATAAAWVVSARVAGEQMDDKGIVLLVVEQDTPGINIQGFATVDGGQAAELTFDNVHVSADNLLCDTETAAAHLQQAAVDGLLAYSAEAIGMMEVLYKDTASYTSEREQFDHPLAQFQVVQHRLVDMFMEYEQCKSLLYRATLETVQSGLEALPTVHALKYMIGKHGIFIAENAVQLHGGMGMTEELNIGHFLKRMLAIDAAFGNADYHLSKFADV